MKLFPLYLLLHFFCTLKWTFNCVAPCQNRKRMIQLMCTFSTKGKTISIFPSFEVNTPIIYLNTFSNEGQKVFKAAQAAGCPSFTLVTISDLDWNHDMVPWDSPPAFKNAAPCTGGADDYLRLLTVRSSQRQRRRLTELRGWVFSGGAVCAVCHLPDGPVFPCRQHVRLSLVFKYEKVYLLP